MMRRLLSVGWAPIVVVLLHAGLAAVFGHQRQYDPVFHFIGGSAGAYSLFRLLHLYRPHLRAQSGQSPVLTVLVAMVVATVVWEVVEFTSDHFLGTHVQLGTADTAADILLGVLGALAVLAVAALLGRNRKVSGSAV